MAPNTRPSIGTLQKHMPTPTWTAIQLNRRAVISKVGCLFNHDLNIINFIIFRVSQIVTPSDYE